MTGRLMWMLSLCLLLLPGCAEIRVRDPGSLDVLRGWEANLLSPEQLSPRTLQALRRWDVERAYRSNPEAAHVQLQEIISQTPDPEVIFALAELSHLLGGRAEKRNPAAASAYYYLCAGYAYHYLFDGRVDHTATGATRARVTNQTPGDSVAPALVAEPFCLLMAENPYDPRFRLACDLYNVGLAKCIRAAQQAGQLDPGAKLLLPTPDGAGFRLRVVQHGFAWQAEEFGSLRFCSDFEVLGLRNRHQTYGLGVPLMGTRPASPDASLRASGSELRYSKQLSFPVTAFFRFNGTLADLGARRCGTLELYNPLVFDTIDVEGRIVALETDLTTPLAYYLAHTDLDQFELLGFLFPDELQSRKGLYSLEPYQPGKIPVVMVHGLLSTPVTWAPMFNDLRADPVLRERFQFWLYRYPTGQPYLVTAAELRETMRRVREHLDPAHDDPALDEMVFVGHSMGGLVSELLTQDSGEDFWRIVSDRPLDSLRLKLETRSLLHDILYFERQPYVKRVVFLGTPHRGSKLSPSWPVQVLARCVRLPRTLLGAVEDAMTQNPGFWSDQKAAGVPTSIDLLKPDSPALELLANRPKPAGVHYHSVIGIVPTKSIFRQLARAFGEKELSDGVVPVRSAQRADVDSELFLETDHIHIHQHPLAVLEVRRILLEHLQHAR